MPEYVYALHDFLPEHEDEVSFHAGERIEVVEKDDLYGDGWWQGRNLAGKVGLFPKSYTAPAPPDSVSISSSSSITEANPQTNSAAMPAAKEEPQPIAAPVPQAAPAIFLNGFEASDSDSRTVHEHQRKVSNGDEVMKATMTDVQKAIEQLGTSGEGDEARSFSFASSTGDQTEGDGETDTDFDISDMDGEGETWHKGARTKLAEKARRAVEEAEKLEAMMSTGGLGRVLSPPIEVELSDESEGEEEFTTHSNIFTRIPEEDEEDVDPKQLLVAAYDDDGGVRTATAAQTSFPLSPDTSMASGSTTATETPNTPQSEDAPRASFQSFASSGAQSSYSNPEPTTFSFPDPPNFSRPGSNRNSGDTNNNHNHSYAPYRESLIALPSPTGSFPGTPVAAGHSKHSSIASVSSMSMRPSASASAMSQPPLTASSIQYTLVEEREKEAANEKGDKRDKDKSPSEWSVEEVVEWLKLKGFDKDVCDKFIEQEITGDVLLELDVNLLKSEIGIMAFGKRMRIANAITDLRRPPSIVYSDHTDARPPQSPLTPHSPPMYHAHAHAHAHTRQPSQHSFPGAGAGASLSVPYAPSMQASSSVGSPLLYGSGLTSSYTESPATDYLGPPEGSAMGVSVSAPAMNGNGNGNGNGKAAKGRPAQLMLSPSDGALKESAKAVSDIIEQEDEERGIASEGEVVHTTSMRRRLFGRSHDSAGSKADSNSRHSKEGSLIASPVISEGREKGKDKEKEKEKEKEKDKERDKDKESMKSSRHARAKKSFDGGRGGDRLSIFGGTFSGSLGGKSRKPPPKYAGSNSTDGTHDEHGSDKSSLFTIPRLHSSGSRKVSSTQSTPNGTPKNGYKEPKVKDSPKPVMLSVREPRDPALLRKRTSSAPPPSDAKHATNTHVSAMVAAGLESPLKQGQSILAQIGEADHSGWMRKKGERYNSWKLRYFIIKGQHMYYLRSNSPSETKIKGYINIVGYKVTVDENVNPGRYGFRIEHDNDKTHYFSSDEKTIIRDWMKAIMKATIGRDYTKPVISSCNIPTIPLTVAQAMSPAPRPPSPTARDATQKALRRENPNQLSSRDARILMGLPSSNDNKEDRTRLESFFDGDTLPSPVEDLGESPVIVSRSPAVPSRPSREMRRQSITRASISVTPEDTALIEWANSHLPLSLQIKDPTGSVCGGLSLLRIAESVKGRPMSPSVPDSAFPQSPTDDKLDGLFQLFDFLLDNDVKMGSVSINDVRQGKRDKILQLLRALKAWEDKRRAIHNSIGSASSVQAGGFMAPSTVAMVW